MLEKDVRLIDGRPCEDPCSESVLFSIGHSRSLVHPAISVALFDKRTPPRGLKKHKKKKKKEKNTPVMEGEGWRNNQRGGRKDRGRSEERRGMRQKRGLAVSA